MDIASILGLAVAAASIAYAAAAGGGGAAAFVDGPALLCVVGGCVAALLLCYPLGTVLGLGRALRTALAPGGPADDDIGAKIVDLAETARREGLLALDARLVEIRDPFLLLGIEMVVDGTAPEVIDQVLRAEMDLQTRQLAANKSLLDQLGRFAPAFGMIGTLLGLVMMLGNMADPSAIGPGMAVALLTTLYGALLANAVCLPLAERLNFMNKRTAARHEMMLRGILAIQLGDSPRVVRQKLRMQSWPVERTFARAA